MSPAPVIPTLAQAQRLVRAGRLDEAEKQCRQVLKANKRDAGACRLLTHLAVMRGDEKAAAAAAQKWIAVASKDPLAHAALGEIRVNQGRFDEAIARYDKALRIQRDHPASLIGKAEVHLRRQEHEAGCAVLEPLVRDAAEDAAMAVTWARLVTALGRADEAITVAGRHLDDADATAETRRSLHFALGKAHERRGDFDAAFAAYAEGNRATDSRYDPVDDAARTDAIIRAFDRDTLGSLPRPAEPSALPVFIVGMPRCGSTLTEQIIDAHPKAFGAGELPDMSRLVDALPITIGSASPWPACARDLDADDVTRLARTYLDTLRRAGRGFERVADKDLFNFRNLGLIEVLFPAGRVIHCRRNAVDTGLSCFCERFPAGTVGFAQDLATIGQAWQQYAKLMDHWRAVLSIPLLEVDYEQLVTDQEAVSRRIIDFLGLDWDERCLRAHETGRAVRTLSHGQVSKPMYVTSVGRAERFGTHLDPLRAALEADA